MIVVKVGGSKGINYDLVLQDLAKYHDVVFVHGGSDELNTISTKLGKPPETITSASGYVSRRTDRETLDIFNMVYCGKMNKMIVEKLQRLNVNAIGLSGIDGRLLMGKRKDVIAVENGRRRIIRDDYTGKVEAVNTDLLRLLLQHGYFPVITPPALSYDNEAINVDGDRAAALIASQLHADTLIILSNTPGLLRDEHDESSLVPIVTRESFDQAMSFAKDRMKKKVLGAFEALNAGVTRVVFADARKPMPIMNALQGQGTVIQ
jgi:acetylglutamate/LysW-gamma-L-alpha-aminoadipate kinase